MVPGMIVRAPPAMVYQCPAGGVGLGPSPIDYTFERYLGRQVSPTDLTVQTSGSGWGILLVAQSYSPLWTLSGGIGPAFHAVANVGLNGWLVNTSHSIQWHAAYSGDSLERTALVLEASAGVPIAIGLGVVAMRRRGRGAGRVSP
jgi:hypothetical protein